MSEIQPGDGWRLLGPEEVVFPLDELYFAEGGSWHQMSPQNFLCKAKLWTAVRRRIPVKPEAMEIEAENGPIELEVVSGQAWVTQCWNNSVQRVGLTEITQIRQVIAWLQQVAEWREAQDSE